jgi:hypothetical protein
LGVLSNYVSTGHIGCANICTKATGHGRAFAVILIVPLGGVVLRGLAVRISTLTPTAIVGSMSADLFGTHSQHRAKATLIYWRMGNLRAVQKNMRVQ